MFDLLMDFTNIPAEYTLYASFMLGLTVKFLWAWNIEYSFMESTCKPAELGAGSGSLKLYEACGRPFSPLLRWIAKYIRAKEGLGSDSKDADSSILLKFAI